MKLRSLCFALALAGTACAKSNDVEPMHKEATALAAFYIPQVDALERRSIALEKNIVKYRSNPDIGEAVRVFNDARGKIAELKGMAQKAPSAIAMASGGAKDPAPAKTGSGSNEEGAPDPDPKWKLERLMDEMRERFQLGIVAANSTLDAVESWISAAERYVPPTAPPAADEAPAAPADDPAAPPTDEPAPTK